MKTIEIPQLGGSSLSEKIEIGDNLMVLHENRESAPVGFGLWRIMSPADGDKRVIWNPDSFIEIQEASVLFKKLIKAGMVPYICDAQGRPTGEVMAEFDPLAGEVDFREVVFAPKKLAVGG